MREPELILRSVNYKLLGILQELAPDAHGQEQCAELYRTMQRNNESAKFIMTELASIISDGAHHGTWPWNEGELVCNHCNAELIIPSK